MTANQGAAVKMLRCAWGEHSWWMVMLVISRSSTVVRSLRRDVRHARGVSTSDCLPPTSAVG